MYIAPVGNGKEQLTILTQKALHWAQQIHHSSLTNDKKWIAYQAVLLPSLLYPLVIHNFTEQQLHQVQMKVTMITKNALNLNRTFHVAVYFELLSYGGLGITLLFAEQGAAKMEYFLCHL